MSSSAAIKEKIDSLNKEAFEIRNTDTNRSIALSKEAQVLADEINYPEGKAASLNNEGFCYVQITNYELSLEKCFEALKIFSGINNPKGIALTRYNLGLAYQRLGDYTLSLDHISKSMEYQQSVNDRFEMARCYLQLGFLYGWLHDNETSIEMYTHGLQINREISNQAGEAACLMGLGQTYLQLKEYDKCNDNLFSSMGIRKQIGDMRGYAAAMASYLTYCFETEKYKEGEALAKEGIQLATELGDRMGIARFMVDLGKIYLKQNKTDQAEHALLDALSTAEKIGLKMAVPPSNFFLSEIYEKKGDHKKALSYYQRFHESNQELVNTDSALKAKSVQLTGKIEKAQNEAEINRLRNVELKNAFDVIAEKNKDITDSINYALRIQQAMLPELEEIKKQMPESFVLYKPRDIVSGDFYWFHPKGNSVFLACADCTGHGVPGAFMSMIGSSLLNEIVVEKQIQTPSLILDELRNGIIKALKQKNENSNNQDGMDIALVRIDLATHKLEFAGANNPLFIIRNGEMKEIAADKMPIGTFVDINKPFTNNTAELKKGDSLYLFSDGYADQFGGPKGKKFSWKRTEELLCGMQDKKMEEQKNTLNSALEEWKKETSQTDDILIIGIKI